MEDGQVAGAGGQVLLPHRYWVFLNPDDLVALEADGEALGAELMRYLQALASQSDARFAGELRVAVHTRAGLGPGQLEVRAAYGSEPGGSGDTQGVQVVTQSAADAGRWSLQLGERFFALGEPVVRLGRALSNDVILEDRRVSRRHAQLRWRAGGYHLSDMGSSSGSSLNGRLVQPGQEVPLAEGDVISLAGLILKVHVRGGQPTT
jgi:hypothetical protein